MGSVCGGLQYIILVHISLMETNMPCFLHGLTEDILKVDLKFLFDQVPLMKGYV